MSTKSGEFHKEGQTSFMKSFDQTFSKVCGVLGQSPESRPQVRNILNGISIREANYWFIFFGLLLQRKNGDDLLNVTRNGLYPALETLIRKIPCDSSDYSSPPLEPLAPPCLRQLVHPAQKEVIKPIHFGETHT